MLVSIGLFIASVASFSWLDRLTSSASHQVNINKIDWTQVSNSTTFFFEHITDEIYGKAAAVNYTELPDTAKHFFENQTAVVKDAFVQIEWEDLPQTAKDYVKDHPAEVALIVVQGLVFIAPELLTIPVLEAVGFARLGPVARFPAAAAQAYLKNVRAGSWFSIFQSARMGGYGRPIVNGAARAGTGLWAGLSWIWGRRGDEGEGGYAQTQASSLSSMYLLQGQ
ncbi:hypothetical protein IAU59_000349 [Kwoniella sp. CBS 9459]